MTKNNEISQLFLFFFVVIFLISVFFITPSLQVISLLTLLTILFLSPLVTYLESKKINKIIAILTIFLLNGIIVGLFISWVTTVAISQWNTLAQSLPGLSNELIQKIHSIEIYIQEKFHIQFEFGLSSVISQAGSSSASWLVSHATSLLSSFASMALMVPIFSFFILKDAELYRREILKLVPARYYSEVVTTFSKTSSSLGKFIRAKALEALLVSIMTDIGLLICGAQYAAVLSLVAGVTNILPYIGPVLGVIPALALLGFSWPVIAVYGIVNVIDLLVIVPVFVGKLVNLSPLTMIIAVAVGQELYGLVGMLVSVPVASSLKIIYQEVVSVLYSVKKLE